MAKDADDAAITAAIIDLGKNLNLRIIAEGVEDDAQLRFLREHRCDGIQGFLFSRPLIPADRETLLTNERGRLAVSNSMGRTLPPPSAPQAFTNACDFSSALRGSGY